MQLNPLHMTFCSPAKWHKQQELCAQAMKACTGRGGKVLRLLHVGASCRLVCRPSSSGCPRRPPGVKPLAGNRPQPPSSQSRSAFSNWREKHTRTRNVSLLQTLVSTAIFLLCPREDSARLCLASLCSRCTAPPPCGWDLCLTCL
jgi:hypothetical protein